MTIFERVTRHAERCPGQTALVWPGGRLDYAALRRQIEAAMQVLRESAAEVLAIDLESGPAWVAIDIAAMQLGICLVPLPAFFSAGQLLHVLRLTGAQAVISDAPTRLRRRVGELLSNAETQCRVADQPLSWVETLASAGSRPRRIPGSVHKVTFTSGTTGEPKGVMLSWAQMVPVVRGLVDAVGMTANDRHLALMPLAVLLENIGGVYVSLWAGATLLLLPAHALGMSGSSGLDGRRMVQALDESQASTAIFTPQTLQGVVEALELSGDARPGLRFAAVGGAPVSPRLLQRAGASGLPVFEGYGLSECGSVVCLNTPAYNRPGSVGRPLPHVRLRITDEGEVVVAGQPFRGYLGEESRSGNEWHSGDLGELDAEGYLYLRGRRRNVFITAYGRNVAPEWVERELMLEPAIAQAAVFGEARAHNTAVIVISRGAAAPDVEAALARVNRILPDYARVLSWVAADRPFCVADGLLTGTGRIRRDAVQRRYRRDIESIYSEAQIP